MRFECHSLRIASCQTKRSLFVPAVQRERIISRELIPPSLPLGESEEKEDTKGALTLSSGDKGPILGPHGVLTRQWERTLGEKYPGLRTDGIFSNEKRREALIRRREPRGMSEGGRTLGIAEEGEGRICGKRGCNEAASQARI